jgi:general secretion pathway protein J
MSFRRRHSEAGFTLIEILLAVSLVAVIAAMVFGSLYLTTTAIDRARTGAADEQIMRSTLRVMAEELATSVNQATSPWLGINAQLDGQPADTVAFLAVGQFRGTESAQETELARVVYTREGDRLLRFVRRNLYGITDESIDRLELANNVKSFNVRYYDGAARLWADEWDGRSRNKGPVAVLLELTFTPDNVELRTIRQWVSVGAQS